MRGTQLGIFIVLTIAIWFWRYQSGLIPGLQEGRQVRVTGTVSQQPTIKQDQFTGEEYQWLWVEVGSEIFGSRADRWLEIDYGDKLVITGILKLLNSSNHPIKSFNIFSRQWVVDKPEIRILKHELGIMGRIRGNILSLFRQTLPRNEAGLLSGMVLGTKGELSPDFRAALQTSGTIHVVVASGFNVMLIAGTIVSVLLLWFRRQTAVILGTLGIWGYVALVGFEAPVVRAGLMGTLAFLGIATGRVRDTGWLLLLTVAVMLWWQPVWLWDVGFQLSVAATAGLIWIEPALSFRSFETGSRVEEKTIVQAQHSGFFPRVMSSQIRNDSSRHPVLSGLNPVLASVVRSHRTTLAAQLAVLPILLHTFGQVSIWSPAANALVLWVVPLVTSIGMLLGLIAIVMGGIGDIFVNIALWIIWPLLHYFVIVVEWFGNFSTLHWQIPWWGFLVYYVILWWIVSNLYWKKQKS